MNPAAKNNIVVPTISMLAVMLTGGCANPDVNPTTAKPGTGYVDFYTDDDSGLCWEIRKLVSRNDKGKILLEEFRPRTNEVIRLAFAPGEYLLRISFLNRAVPESSTVNVLVEDGKISTVRVTLVEIGETVTERKDVSAGGTFYGRAGRSTKLRASEGATFRVQTEAEAPAPYRPKPTRFVN